MLERHRESTGVVGAALGVVRGDRVVVAAGHAGLQPLVLITPDTRFQIVSITKVMVGTVIARLAGLRLVSIDDPVRDHVPETRVASWSGAVTLRQLVANTAGVPGARSRVPRRSRGGRRPNRYVRTGWGERPSASGLRPGVGAPAGGGCLTGEPIQSPVSRSLPPVAVEEARG